MRKWAGIGLIVVAVLCLVAIVALSVSAGSPMVGASEFVPSLIPFVVAFPLALVGGLLLLVVRLRAPKRNLTIPAEGTLVATQTAGTVIDGRPQFKLTVRFTTESGQEVTADDYVHDGYLRNVGSPVSLRYNPTNPAQIRIDQPGDFSSDNPGVTYGTEPTNSTTRVPVHTYALGNGHSVITVSGETSVVAGSFFGGASAMSASAMAASQDELAEIETVLDGVSSMLRQRTAKVDAWANVPGSMSAEDQARVAHGIPARGVVLQSSPTGAIVADSAELSLRVEVTRPDGTRFQADTVQPVPQPALPLTTPGSVVNVYYRPEDEQHITIQFVGAA